MRFSSRLSTKRNGEPIINDAPKELRIGYVKQFLGDFVGEPQGRSQSRYQPLECREVHTKFIALIREELEPWDFDGERSWDQLTDHLKKCSWTDFFDFVEMIGRLLIEADDEIPFGSGMEFSDYRTKVNGLFLEDGIGWNLNEKSELQRHYSRKISEKIKAAEGLISDEFSAARIHYQKASQYLHRHPIDEANCIKEIISAIESTTKVLDPRISTLGDATKKLRANKSISPHLLDALEKINVYSNATPLVRHGHTDGIGPNLEEAELIFMIGVAYIRFLISTSKATTTNQP